MILSILYLLFFALCGIAIGRYVFSSESFARQIWLGLTLGLFGSIWLPSLFSFVLSFGALSHILGAAVMGMLAVFSACSKRARFASPKKDAASLASVLILLPLFLLGAYLFSTHILRPQSDGLYVGQTTYGDLAMHLGFISSIAEQGFFPPEYSIFPGHRVNYPFLCEVPSASLFRFGANLRWAYLLPALYAYGLVILGVFFAFKAWLKRADRARFATYLFFLGGGFGFLYFFDRLGGASTVGALIDESGYATNLSFLLNDFYVTPTNLPRIGLRWVNPIVDMLIPQRATLFGWAFLFPCLYLLLRFAFSRQEKALPPLILLAGGLPLIHTHSFLALGIVSAVYCLQDLIGRFSKQRLLQWLSYGLIAVALAAPQLFGFAFAQASESGMVRLHFNWANEVDSFLWFYVKNLGWLFILLPFGLLLLSRRDRRIARGFLVLWLVSEVVVFQPNIYDNNKLLFAWFFCLCALTSRLLGYLAHRARAYLEMTPAQRRAALGKLGALAAGLGIAFYLTAFFDRQGGALMLPAAGILTELVVLSLLLFVHVLALREADSARTALISFLSAALITALMVILLNLLIRNSDSRTIPLSLPYGLLLLGAGVALLLLCLPLTWAQSDPKPGRAGAYLCQVLISFLLGLSLFLSGPMTILREWRSSYMVFTRADMAAADFIRENTDPHDLFLTDYSWHLNTVSVLTGRSIVCGPDLFLYYHGIDTGERRADVTAMFESPSESEELFRDYGVRYVYIGHSERANFDIDTAYFNENATLVYQEDGIWIYDLAYEG